MFIRGHLMRNLATVLCVFFMSLVPPSISAAAEYSAEEVMHMLDERYDGDSFISDMTMVLIDKRDRQRIRSLKLYSKDYGLDTKT
tara:strand:- start:86 stop:340 length:255 start_codon:yes stop_codon:yes gene_type:complete